MRHAKSDWGDPQASDFDRPLNARGSRDVPRVARFLAQNFQLDLILSSSAVRARQTAEGLAAQWPNAEFVLDGDLYLANPRTLSSAVSAADNRLRQAIVIAHNPGLEDWVHQLTGTPVVMPAAAVACVQADTDDWASLVASGDRLRWLIVPRMLS